MMKLTHFFLLFFVAISLSACGSSERTSNRAQAEASNTQAEVNNERLKLIEEYKKCTADAGADSAKAETCESYLKAANALQ